MRTICLLGAFVFTLWARAQNTANELAALGRSILEEPAYVDRLAANEQFTEKLMAYVASSQGYNDELSEVTNMMRLQIPDAFTIYSWMMPDSAFKYEHLGLVVGISKKGERVITLLQNARKTIEEPQYQLLSATHWFGAVYYQVVPKKKKRRKKQKKVFTLLGYAPDDQINQKIVEVITIDKKGKPTFGAKIFKLDEFMDLRLRQPATRLVLQYNGDYSASVKWNEEEKMIIMDHLSPADDRLKGVYQTYGPDMSYDGLRWEKGWWVLEKEVDFNSGQDVKIIPPNKGRGLPKRPHKNRSSKN